MLINIVEPFSAWLAYGMQNGWISEPLCLSHGEMPVRMYEELEIDMGFDPCIYVVRMWVDGKEADMHIEEPSPEVASEDD